MNMKKTLFIIFALTPLALFASGEVETDIVPRLVNFVIFAAIIYYLLAEKIKDFFLGRTKSIQSELDEVQRVLEQSEKKVTDAKAELENSKQLALTLVQEAKSDIDSIKQSIEESFEKETSNLNASFGAKIELEAKKAKKQIVEEVLHELLASENIELSQEDLTKIILKKVA
jgi:F-type H+-transporting ATPase subunit b